MELVVFGVSHHTADVELRERLTWPEAEIPAALLRARELPGVAECVLVSTCNRTEIYTWMEIAEDSKQVLTEFLSKEHDVDAARIQTVSYYLEGDDVVRHLYRVVSGLDSMVLGETQVLNQIKEAYMAAQGSGTAGKMLHALFSGALSVGKRLHTETAIGQNAVSVSYAAVELARKIFGRLEDRKVLLIGAGETAELTARYLYEAGVSEIRVANRTLSRAEMLAQEYHGKAVPLDRVADSLREVDVIISSTGSSELILTRSTVQAALRHRYSPLFIVDIAVPRDVDPQIQGLDHVFLYDIDDLKTVVASNLQARLREAQHAQRILEEEVAHFRVWRNSLDAVPLIRSLYEKAERIRRGELERYESRLDTLTAEQRDALEGVTRGIVNKLLNDPVLRIKQMAGMEESSLYMQAFSRLFNLGAGGPAADVPEARRDEQHEQEIPLPEAVGRS